MVLDEMRLEKFFSKTSFKNVFVDKERELRNYFSGNVIF